MVKKTLDNVWRSVELPKFNLYQLQLFEFPTGFVPEPRPREAPRGQEPLCSVVRGERA
jgi:hypothetical protein